MAKKGANIYQTAKDVIYKSGGNNNNNNNSDVWLFVYLRYK